MLPLVCSYETWPEWAVVERRLREEIGEYVLSQMIVHASLARMRVAKRRRVSRERIEAALTVLRLTEAEVCDLGSRGP